MGCGPAVAGIIRSAGVFVVSIILSTRTPGSITRESMAPSIRAAMAAAVTQRLGRALMIVLWSCRMILAVATAIEADPVPAHFQISHHRTSNRPSALWTDGIANFR